MTTTGERGVFFPRGVPWIDGAGTVEIAADPTATVAATFGALFFGRPDFETEPAGAVGLDKFTADAEGAFAVAVDIVEASETAAALGGTAIAELLVDIAFSSPAPLTGVTVTTNS